ncbi:MAG TPA: hypothetical protein VK668_22120 [Mucilaginibacter sp.]|nr:hypothetical protein [Mucilaginibacter sp.]
MKNTFILLVLLFLSMGALAQSQLSKTDSIEIAKLDAIQSQVALGKLKDQDYLLLCVSYKFLLIVRQEDSYMVFKGEDFFDWNVKHWAVDSLKSYQIKKNRKLDYLFTKQVFQPAFLYSQLDNKFHEGEAFYDLRIIKNHVKICEYKLPAFNSDDGKDWRIPLPLKTVQYLFHLCWH